MLEESESDELVYGGIAEWIGVEELHREIGRELPIADEMDGLPVGSLEVRGVGFMVNRLRCDSRVPSHAVILLQDPVPLNGRMEERVVSSLKHIIPHPSDS